MRAIQFSHFGDASVLVPAEVAAPRPGPRDVLVRVHAAAVNPVDTKIRKGAQRAVIRHRFPFVPGMDLAGTITEVGREVRSLAVGDEVFASPSHRRMGAYAEYAVVDEGEVAKKPRSVDFVEAASLPLVALTAWDALVTHGQLQRGQSVLIQAGAGGVGTVAIQLAKHLGARVLTTASERNADLVRELGADVVIDYRREKYEEVAAGVDLVVESMGPDHFTRALAATRRGGRITSLTSGLPEAAARYGPYLGVVAVGLSLAAFTVRARLTKGVVFRPVVRVASAENLARIAQLVDDGALRPVIDSVLPLDQAADAHRRVETGRSRGKVVLSITPDASRDGESRAAPRV